MTNLISKQTRTSSIATFLFIALTCIIGNTVLASNFNGTPDEVAATIDANDYGEASPTIVSISGTAITQLMRNLQRQLVRDGLIVSKSVPTTIEIPGSKIVVNGQELSSDLYNKYMGIFVRYGVGYGPNRMIKLDEKSMQAGDFVASAAY